MKKYFYTLTFFSLLLSQARAQVTDPLSYEMTEGRCGLSSFSKVYLNFWGLYGSDTVMGVVRKTAVSCEDAKSIDSELLKVKASFPDLIFKQVDLFLVHDASNAVAAIGLHLPVVEKNISAENQIAIMVHEYGHLILRWNLSNQTKKLLPPLYLIKDQKDLLRAAYYQELDLDKNVSTEMLKQYMKNDDSILGYSLDQIKEDDDSSEYYKQLEHWEKVDSISTPFEELYADLIASIYTQNPNAISNAESAIFGLNSINTWGRSFNDERASWDAYEASPFDNWTQWEPHILLAPARHHLGKLVFKDKDITSGSAKKALKAIDVSLREILKSNDFEKYSLKSNDGDLRIWSIRQLNKILIKNIDLAFKP